MDDSVTATVDNAAAHRLTEGPPVMAVEQVIAEQRRRRRLRIVAGLALILLPGLLWAGLTKDPARQGRDEIFFDAPARAVPIEAAGGMPFAFSIFEENVELADGESLTRTLDPFTEAIFDLSLESGDLLVVSVTPFDTDEFFSDVPLEISVDGPSSGLSSSLDQFTGGEVEFPAEADGSHLVRVAGSAPMDVTLSVNPGNDGDADE